VILGQDVARTLFGKENAVDKNLRIGPHRYRVIGVLASKGNTAEFGDKRVLIPLNTARRYFGSTTMPYSLEVMVPNSAMLDVLYNEGLGIFRKIRRVAPGEADNFD